jgi:hypothetical protein
MMNRDGIAALFDALIFLAIASLVAVALLSAFSGGEQGPDEEVQSRVEAAHLVLLRSTLRDAGGNDHPVEELFKLEGVGDGEYQDPIEDVTDLLLPGLGWRWTVQCGDTILSYGSATLPGPREPLFCSLVRAPLNGEEVVFRLEAWST